MDQTSPGIEWRRSLAWLAVLAPLFFVSYGWSNEVAASRGVTDSVVFAWEQHIPFVPWTIVPYWSIDLFYGLSFLMCRTPRSVDRHGLRLLSAQFVSVACFVLFPLHFSFERPPVDGVLGAMFGALSAFDQPYNQAPSLHISLLVILWYRFTLSLRGPWRLAAHLWALLIAVSVLTTYQHHFIDVPSGALVGLLCLWLWPESGASPLRRDVVASAAHVRIAAAYALGAALLAALATRGGAALVLAWPALSLLIVAFNYAWAGAAGFQKTDGRHSLAAKVLLAPHRWGARLNAWLWTRRQPAPSHVAGPVWLGRLPRRDELAASGFSAVCDLTAELAAPGGPVAYSGVPMLDLLPPDPARLQAAVCRIERDCRDGDKLLVCCALGYSRSAIAVAAWLQASGRAASFEEALALVRRARPQVVVRGATCPSAGLAPAINREFRR